MLDTHFHSSLRLQFLLSELLKSQQETPTKNVQIHHLFPFDWGTPAGHLTKLYAHIHHLGAAFPEHPKIIKQLSKKKVAENLQSILSLLEPLIASCKEDENLFLFLLKNQKQIDRLMHPHYLHDLLVKIYPEGLEVVGEKHCDQYHRRGFFFQISECKLLLTQLLYARPSTSTCL